MRIQGGKKQFDTDISKEYTKDKQNKSGKPSKKERLKIYSYLPICFKDTYTEAYCTWNDDMKPNMSKKNPWGIIFR